MAERSDYYRILHVQRDAPAEVIRSSYRTMMQKLKMHPDLGGDHAAAALINEAFAVLNNPVARAEYDAVMAAAGAANWQPDESGAAAPGPAPQDEPADNDTFNNESPGDPNPAASDQSCLFCFESCRPARMREPDDVCRACGSPLYPAEQRRFEVDSQRAIERIPKRTAATFVLRSVRHSRHAGTVQDISLNGMQLRTHTELDKGQIVLVTTGVLDAVARVVDSRRLPAGENHGGRPAEVAPWRVGLVFLTMKIHRLRGSFVSVDA